MARKERLAPSTYDEEKVKRTFLCFICSYVKMDVFRSQYEKMNVFVKPDEQCRACSNMVMARKERLAPSTYDEEIVKRTFLCLLCSYVKKDVSRSQYEVLNDSPFTYPLVYSSICQLANLPKPVNFSVIILTR